MEISRIFHVDMDAFFVAVEELLDPSLKGKPVVVGAQPGHRGVVAAASYEARKFGIHSAMPVSEAVRRCPQAIFLPGHSNLYSKYSNEVHKILCRYSPIVEMVSIDEGYLDMTGTERMFFSARSSKVLHQRAMDDTPPEEEQTGEDRAWGRAEDAMEPPERRRPTPMALDPRNLLGVSIASSGADGRKMGMKSSFDAEYGGTSKRELDIHELATSGGAAGRRSPESQTATSREPASTFRSIRGHLDSDFFMMSVATRLRDEIVQRTGLSASIGIGTSRLVAKVASDLAKPRGIFLVAPGREAALLAPLNIRRIPGIGPKTEKELNDLGVHTVGDLQKCEAGLLKERFGSWGDSLAIKAQGGSDWRYLGNEDPKSISHENTFAEDTSDREQIESTLVYLIQRVGKRLRDHRLYASTLQMKLRDSKFRTITRAVTLSEPTDIDAVILKNGLALLHHHWDGKSPVRLIGIGVCGLTRQGPAAKLIDGDQSERLEKLYQAADAIREKYGFDMLKSPRGGKRRPE
ncbi:MAG: DNA polymerase IV [Acidobacteriia bacterium]|nr:DNA polymerase IV [Terriglobia bacterium]